MNYRRTLSSIGITLFLSTPAFAYDLSYEEYTSEDLAVVKKAETSTDAEVIYNAANILMSESMMQENIEQGIKYLVVTPIDLLMVKFTFYKRSNNLIVHLFAFRKTNGFSY
ncbi:hypothetical protein PDPUS_2_00857 [Photobacterium damselae subsp. piscicida]|uniref:Uncharacterized protein n=1 Tax=Photobacterium damsela subsp. piscicida TaxID=38294 RepID=A0A1V1VDJ5_PHODP|nr:hypothetical protein [Photobacterium damselae]MBE8127255.1 hypothetical protein [Photobacterium damselae subsp. piscicida]MDP2567344.1 hypothetical protein [Photobacterium damselae subsp. piscicida]QOD54881.1 hypothetical protein IC628_18170 [Photobacterium damselae subsp. piscicida]QOD58230.1 hypothetical protein IC627_20945 [Photobacterium damselae subsp. piscicida]BAX55443.1 hypothetical protein PDPUS_2_00857 [Photobacterium damselae subsp. piscicida]